ncbi:ferredoxin [Friedmanniella endophytica]|uniref:Ferredoxin n=1 Tax=Microlunatus kandeliicorticis TaxID=1759536 RepID=A0A7W3IQK5_9ACTN|nr:ferredoxin [Microlunatus kandeliicorticis]MBA8793429.1 ferredoxin [Microlunatus kandeliicorticis]
MRIRADHDVCIGAGNCVLSAPAVFDQDDDGLVELLVDEVPDDEREAAEVAVRRCPSGALTLED